MEAQPNFYVQNRSGVRTASTFRPVFFLLHFTPPALSSLSAMDGRPPPPYYARSSALPEGYARPFAGEEHPSGAPSPSLPVLMMRGTEQPNPNHPKLFVCLYVFGSDLITSAYTCLRIVMLTRFDFIFTKNKQTSGVYTHALYWVRPETS